MLKTFQKDKSEKIDKREKKNNEKARKRPIPTTETVVS